MSERMAMGTPLELEAALVDLGRAIAWPPSADLSAAVTARLVVAPSTSRPIAAPSAPMTARDRDVPWWRRSLPRALLLAAALALLLAGVAIGVRFGLELLSIGFGPGPTASASPSAASPSAAASTDEPPGSSIGLGDLTTLASVSSEAAFPVAVPADLGPPDAVYLGGPRLRGQVAFVYAPRGDLQPSSYLDGAGLLVTQNRGDVDVGLVNKIVDSGLGTVQLVDVGDEEGYWFAGAPHWFWYRAPDGTVIEGSRREVGNTLAWQRGDILYRIEGEISLERALEIAASLPAP